MKKAARSRKALPSLLLLTAAWSRAAHADEVHATTPADSPSFTARDRAMNEGTTLTGGVGLVHTQHASSGATGQFQVAFTTEYFSASFLCTSTYPCRDPQRNSTALLTNDTSSHIGGRLSLSMQVFDWLEPYLATSALANSNAANRPALLQVLGDSTLGAKVHTALGHVVHVGGAVELGLVNGTGAVGLDGGGTGAKFRALGTADFRGLARPLPFRTSLNLTYVVDNSGAVVESTESSRGTPITRIERFGLNINRVDHFDVGFGVEAFVAEERVRPFLEYNVAIPINRQGYRCRADNPSADGCIQNVTVAPSSMTLGARFFPWKRGFNVLAAFDIGVTGTGTFVEEVRPEPPWMLYLGAGWAFDTVEHPPLVREPITQAPAPVTGRKVRGFVHEDNRATGIENAIVSWDTKPEFTSLATNAEGHFVTHDLADGTYVFGVRADGYKPRQCSVTLAPLATRADATLDCSLVALPRVGQLVGRVRDADTQSPVANATVRIVDGAKKELVGTTDATGAFRFADLPGGAVQIAVEGEGYLVGADTFDVKLRQENTFDLRLQKRPKSANVTMGKGELLLKQQIQFALDSATLLPESSGLMTEIADALLKAPRGTTVEVQGHTDNAGTPEHNQELSEARANAVVAWLVSHGVAADRLTARGFGQTRPLVPNVTANNRTKNRRVQFILNGQEGAATPSN